MLTAPTGRRGYAVRVDVEWKITEFNCKNGLGFRGRSRLSRSLIRPARLGIEAIRLRTSPRVRFAFFTFFTLFGAVSPLRFFRPSTFDRYAGNEPLVSYGVVVITNQKLTAVRPPERWFSIISDNTTLLSIVITREMFNVFATSFQAFSRYFPWSSTGKS